MGREGQAALAAGAVDLYSREGGFLFLEVFYDGLTSPSRLLEHSHSNWELAKESQLCGTEDADK